MPSFKMTPAQIRAVEELKNYGIDFHKYAARFAYQSSPTRLLNDIYRESRQTMKNLAEMEEEEHAMNDYVYDIYGEGKDRWALFKTNGFRLRIRFSAIVLWLSVNDLKKCFKCIKTMFGSETYVKFLYDIDGFITDYAVEYITFEHTKRIRIDIILGIIEKEIDKYEEG